MSTDGYVIRLRPDEALALSDWLDRVLSTPAFARLVDDRAVWVPLHKIAGVLETSIPEIFGPHYSDELSSARARLEAELGEFEPPDEE